MVGTRSSANHKNDNKIINIMCSLNIAHSYFFSILEIIGAPEHNINNSITILNKKVVTSSQKLNKYILLMMNYFTGLNTITRISLQT